MNNDSMIVYFEWREICEDLSDEEFGQIMRSAMEYAENGENPTFSDRAMRACWKSIQKAIDRNADRYSRKCEKNRENGKKGGRPKKTETVENPKNQTVILGFSEKPNKTLRERERERERERDPERGRGRERERDREAVAPPADTDTTTTLEERIISSWNQHDFVQKIKRVDSPSKRRERTEMAIAVAGGENAFLALLDSLDQHAYLKNRPKTGYTVIYDWFIDPENFQGVLEGRYRDDRKRSDEGYEVVTYDEIRC